MENDIKVTLQKTAKLEAQFFGLNETFWKKIFDAKQRQDFRGKTKRTLLMLAKKIKIKKAKIRGLYEFLLISYPKDPQVIKLFGMFFN